MRGLRDEDVGRREVDGQTVSIKTAQPVWGKEAKVEAMSER